MCEKFYLQYVNNRLCLLCARPSAPGGIPGLCPPNWLLECPPNENCAPPSEDCAPKKLTGLGSSGAQFEGPNWWFLWTDTRFCNVFGMKTFFVFWRSPVFGRKNRLKFRFPPENPISAGKSLEISVKTFFFWRLPVFGRKNRLKFRFRPENSLKF